MIMLVGQLLPERIVKDQLGIGELVTGGKQYNYQDGNEARKDSKKSQELPDESDTPVFKFRKTFKLTDPNFSQFEILISDLKGYES